MNGGQYYMYGAVRIRLVNLNNNFHLDPFHNTLIITKGTKNAFL